MKGFALDDHGDVVFKNNDIQLAYDTDLLIQKITYLLRTNRGEWQLNQKEGIPMHEIIKKDPNLAKVKDYVRSAVSQADASLRVSDCKIETEGRKMKIRFTAANQKSQVSIGLEV